MDQCTDNPLRNAHQTKVPGTEETASSSRDGINARRTAKMGRPPTCDENLDRTSLKKPVLGVATNTSALEEPTEQFENQTTAAQVGGEEAYVASLLEGEGGREHEPAAAFGQLAYVNLCAKANTKEGDILSAGIDADDLYFVELTAGDGTKLQGMIDCGATISGVAQSVLKRVPILRKCEVQARAREREVIYANSEKGNTGATLTDVELSLGTRKLQLPLLYELPLPHGIDILLGLDWFRRQNPDIDWEKGEIKLAQGDDAVSMRRTGTSTHEKISTKRMKRLMRAHPERVTCVIVKDRWYDGCACDGTIVGSLATETVPPVVVGLTGKTSVKQRKEAILESTLANEGLSKKEVHDPSRHVIHTVLKTGNPAFDKLLKEFEDVIQEDLSRETISSLERNINRREIIEMNIELVEGMKPPHCPYRHFSPLEEREAIKVIERYIEQGIIQPSQSPFGAAVLFAPKKDGTLRFCVDWRQLNKQTVKNSAHSQDTQDCLDQLVGSKFFSSLDAAQGYHQVPIKESDRRKTAFNTKYGHWEFRQMSFGLTNAPAVYVQMMNRILSGESYRNGEATAMHPRESLDARALRIEKDPEAQALAVNLYELCAQCYIDDVIVYSKTESDHAAHLKLVLARLREYQLYLKASKCKFLCKELDHLGHRVTPTGIKPMDDKVLAVSDWPVPKTVMEVRQFLGLAGYYRKFIKGYSQIARPLTDLTKKLAPVDDKGFLLEWSDNCQLSFESLKGSLCKAPVLMAPDKDKGSFHVTCDASIFGLGATLSQEDEEGVMRPCAFVSRVLSPTERKHYVTKQRCIYELELIALRFALEKWRVLLEGQTQTTVWTDHKSLIWLETQKILSRTQVDFLDDLARSGLAIRYIKGELNVPADALSRDPTFKELCERLENPACDRLSVNSLLEEANPRVKRRPNLGHGGREYIVADTVAGMSTRGKKRPDTTNTPESRRKKRELSPVEDADGETTLGPQHMNLDTFLRRVHDGYAKDPEWCHKEERKPYVKMTNEGHSLWYKVSDDDERPPRLCIPNDLPLRRQIVTENHEPPLCGHRSAAEVFRKVDRSFFWLRMRKSIEAQIRQCRSCQMVNRNPAKTVGKMIDWSNDYILRPWSSVVMDHVGPFPTPPNCPDKETRANCVLVACCRLTKMVHLIPCRTDDTAEILADRFLDGVFKHHGLSDEFRSDRGSIFTSEFWGCVWDKLGTSISLSTAFRHQTAGQAERTIQELRKYISKYVKDHTEWLKYLPLAEFAFNSAVNSSTDFTPFALNHGFEPRTPADALIGHPMEPNPKRQKVRGTDTTELASSGWLTNLSEQIDHAKLSLEHAHSEMKAQYDKHKANDKGNITFAPVGSHVYLSVDKDMMPNIATRAVEGDAELTTPVMAKWLPRYLGPMKVLAIEGHGDLNRKLLLTPTLAKRLKTDVFHVSRLKRAHISDLAIDLQDELMPPAVTIDGKLEYFVSKILAWGTYKSQRWFRVSWTGYGDEHDAWLPETQMENSAELITAFMDTNPMASALTRKTLQKVGKAAQNVLLIAVKPWR